MQEPIEIPPIINTSVKSTEAAQLGIKPTRVAINGSKKPVEDRKLIILSLPTNSTSKPNTIFINKI